MPFGINTGRLVIDESGAHWTSSFLTGRKVPPFIAAEVRDHRADHQQHHTDGRHWHQNRRDVDCGRQDQAYRSQDLEGSEGLDEADADLSGPSPAADGGQLLLGHEQLGGGTDQEEKGEQCGNDPQRHVHAASPFRVEAISFVKPEGRSARWCSRAELKSVRPSDLQVAVIAGCAPGAGDDCVHGVVTSSVRPWGVRAHDRGQVPPKAAAVDHQAGVPGHVRDGGSRGEQREDTLPRTARAGRSRWLLAR